MLSPFSNNKKALYTILEYAKLLRKEGVENIELTRKYIRPLYPNYNKIKRS